MTKNKHNRRIFLSSEQRREIAELQEIFGFTPSQARYQVLTPGQERELSFAPPNPGTASISGGLRRERIMTKRKNVLSSIQRANVQALMYFEDMTYNRARYASLREEQQAEFKLQGRAAQRRRRAENPRREILLAKKHNAGRRGIEFKITEADLNWPSHCPVTDVELRYDGVGLYTDRRGPRPDAASIDRIDNTRGYVPGNVVIVSHWVNIRKGDATPWQLRQIADFYARLEVEAL